MYGRIAGALLSGMVMVGLAATGVGQAQTVSKDCGWCVITSPNVVAPGEPFDVTVDVKGIAAKTKLAIDLHYRKKDGSFGGFFAWGGGARDVAADGPVTCRFKFDDIKDDLGAVFVATYLSPTGDWAAKTKDATGPEMAVNITQAFLKTVPPKGITYKKSWIYIEPPDPARIIKANEKFEVTVKYNLDPSENWGDGTRLALIPLGPWIDCPDGKYTTSRQHVNYPGLGTQETRVEPGKGQHVFTFAASGVYRYNGLLFVAQFTGGDGKNWPWQVRSGGPRFTYEDKIYQLANDKPGGLFTYDEPVKLRIVFKDGAVKGEQKTLHYRLVNTKGLEIGSGQVPFTVGERDASVAFTPEVKERGTFLLEADVAGWGERELIFARIPDVLKLTGGGKTQFGATNLATDAECKVARMLGLTTCRQFFEWRFIQPGRDTWNFAPFDRILDVNKRHGIEPWVCLTTPPNWVQLGAATDVGYEPFPFDAAAWRASAAAMTSRWKGKISGWEWLNEIVPGSKCQNPVEDYVRFCRIGTETAKKINPSFKTILAGGLWPRTFRLDCLKAGVGRFVDELPVHYSDMGGILDAREDLSAAGAGHVVVSDDENGSGLSTWGMPSREIIQIKTQSQFILDRWPDELAAGATRVTCFGGWTDPAGNWSYLLDPSTPRPLAATIAVLTSKLAGARSTGKFYLPGHAVFHLFERKGKAVLVASSTAAGGEKIALNAGSARVVVTDYQGNETTLQAAAGKVRLDLGAMRVFIEGGDLDVLKSYCAVAIGAGQRVVEYPNATVIKGLAAKVPVTVRNRYARTLEGTVAIAAPGGWPSSGKRQFSIHPGAEQLLEVPVAVPAAVASGEFALNAHITFRDTRLPGVEKPFGLSVISREMVGNLLKNGGFEAAGKSEEAPDAWSLGKTPKRYPSGSGPGLGAHVLRFENCPTYDHAGQTIAALPGRTYLYTAWVWNHDMVAGSNITHVLADGGRKDFFTPQVFMSGQSSPSWRFYSCRTEAPQNIKEIAFTPVVQGAGWAMYDNLRVTIYEGSNYAAECHRARTPLKLDGTLDGWNTSCPLPLLCENQLTVFDKAYRWTPENLSGVAYLMWDSKALYLAVEVSDDLHWARTTGEATPNGDSVVLAIHPARAIPGREDKAFEYYLSTASPGGGSGASTLYRPLTRSGGLSSGQLARDSSVYELAVHTKGRITLYQLRMPWSELGGIAPAFGSKFGISLMLNDNDGSGRAACITWGDGLVFGWSPSHFGIATLVDP